MQTILQAGSLKHPKSLKTTHFENFTIMVLNENHLEQIMALQTVIIDRLSHPDLMAPISLAFMREHLERQGFILGVFVDRQLIAYRIVYFPNDQDKTFNFGFDVGLVKEQRSRVANLQMVCVHPHFRGNGLASKLNRMALRMLTKTHDCEHVFATVSPYNIWNIRILLDGGFCIACMKTKYGGKLRYIVYQNLHTPIEYVAGEVIHTRLEDLEAQKINFESGLHGVALVRRMGIKRRFKEDPLPNDIIFKRPIDR